MFMEFVEAFKLEVWARLQRKTGWGRKEVMGEFEAALNTVLMRLYEQKLEQETKVEKP